MLAVHIRNPGPKSALELVEVPTPPPGPGELLVRNFATALNRADLLQRRGLYPPPPGVTEIPGLEFAGEVAEVGEGVEGFARSDRVFGLVPGGGYAEFLCIDRRLAVPIPDTMSFDAAAAVPEAFCAAHEALFELGGLVAGESVLVHAAASGVGTAAIQLAAAASGHVLATCGSRAKAQTCLDLGAELAVVRHDEDFADRVAQASGGRGVDVIVDLVGGAYCAGNLRSIAPLGRWIVLGLLGGTRAEIDFGVVLAKRLSLRGTVLRSRSTQERVDLLARFQTEVLPLLLDRTVRPVIDRVYPIDEVDEAHRRMEAGLNVGKIVLRL